MYRYYFHAPTHLPKLWKTMAIYQQKKNSNSFFMNKIRSIFHQIRTEQFYEIRTNLNEKKELFSPIAIQTDENFELFKYESAPLYKTFFLGIYSPAKQAMRIFSFNDVVKNARNYTTEQSFPIKDRQQSSFNAF